MWLKSLTIAIVEKDIDRLNDLMDDLPQLDNQADIESAVALIGEAKKLLEGLKNDTQKSLSQIQQHINFLKSTQAPTPFQLDINS